MSSLFTGTLALGAADWFGLVLHFATLSLLAIGGAIATVPDMHRVVVAEKGWLTDAEFSSSIALGQAAPGPNLLFVAVIGFQLGGLTGVAATMLGTLLPSSLLALWVSRWSERNREAQLPGALKAALAPVSLGLLAATGWILLAPVALRWGALALVAATLWLMLRTRLSPMWAIGSGAVLGVLGWV